MNLCQVSQSQLFEGFVSCSLEELGVVSPRVRSQEDTDRLICWETVAGVVDVTRRSVCDALSSMNMVILPEPPHKCEEDFSGAFIVDSPQGVHFLDGEGRFEIDEQGRFGCGRHQDDVSVYVS